MTDELDCKILIKYLPRVELQITTYGGTKNGEYKENPADRSQRKI